MTTPLTPLVAATTLGPKSTPALAKIRPELMTVVEYGRSVGSYGGDRLTNAEIVRSTVQASTLKLTIVDPTRELIRSPLLNEAVTIDTGANPGRRFKLVQVSKSGDTFSVTLEDALVAKLRTQKGQLAAAAGVQTRAGFAAQLCKAAGIPIVVPSSGLATALVPLTRGTTQTTDEDSWACLTRIAQDVAYRCWSDGSSVWFGPDSWLFGLPPAMQIGEFTNEVDYLDFDYDVGKPSAQMTVGTYSQAWTAELGARVSARNVGAASGDWLVQDLSRSLYTEPTKVTLVQPVPTLPEPAPTDTGSTDGTTGTTKTVTFQAST